MKRILFLTTITGFLLSANFAAPAFGQKAKGVNKASSTALTVNSATARRNILKEGNKVHIEAEYLFKIVWNSATPPKEMYFRTPDNEWLKCKASRGEKRPFGGGPNDFMVVEKHASLESFKAGEHITLMPERHQNEIQPGATKAMPSSALYFQLNNSNSWQTVKVKLTKLPDLTH